MEQSPTLPDTAKSPLLLYEATPTDLNPINLRGCTIFFFLVILEKKQKTNSYFIFFFYVKM